MPQLFVLKLQKIFTFFYNNSL